LNEDVFLTLRHLSSPNPALSISVSRKENIFFLKIREKQFFMIILNENIAPKETLLPMFYVSMLLLVL